MKNATYSGARQPTMSARAWERMKLAQMAFNAKAFSDGQRDAASGLPMQPNCGLAYRAGYNSAGRPA